MNKALALIALLAVTHSAGASAAETDFVFVDYAPSELTRQADGFAKITMSLDVGLAWMVHTPRKVESCDSKGLRCLKIGSLVLAVPDRLEVGQEWATDGCTFRVVGTTTIALAGQSISVTTVESQGADTFRFFYNDEKGVVGLLWPGSEEESGEFFLLASPTGPFSRQ